MPARMRLWTSTLLLACLMFHATAALSVGRGAARYVGGTVAGIPEKVEGPIDLKDEDKLVFRPNKTVLLEIPWNAIVDIEYGQKVGRRIGTALLVSPLAMFTKARKHFVTVTFKDAKDKEQGVVFEFDKGDIRQSLTAFKVRSGKEISFQDEEAKKQMGGGVSQSK